MQKTATFFFVLFMGITQPAIANKLGKEQYNVVINHEEQYTIWLKTNQLPAGWKAAGFVGNKDEALQHIAKVSTKNNPKLDRRGDALRIYRELKHKKK